MQQNEQEIVFKSSDEALQMLAEITGKKIMIPDKAEPTIASEANAEQISGEIADNEATHDEDNANDSEIAEGSDSVVQDIDQKIEGLSKIKTQVQDAMSQVKDITGSTTQT